VGCAVWLLMRLWRKHHEPEPKAGSLADAMMAAAKRNQAQMYARGFRDGVAETLAQITGTSTRDPDGCYRGELPDDLLAWITDVSARVSDDSVVDDTVREVMDRQRGRLH
jgi:hypothetical protein